MVVALVLSLLAVAVLGAAVLRLRRRTADLDVLLAQAHTTIDTESSARAEAVDVAERARADAAAALERETRTRRDAAEVATRLRAVSTERDAATERVAVYEDKVEAAERWAAESARDLQRVQGDLDDLRTAMPAELSPDQAQLLWTCELARVERTWTTSVAPGPGIPSGIADAADVVAAALDVEAAAAREDIGTEVELTVGDFSAATPAAALVAVRAVQEAIAHAARSADRLVVAVARDGDEAIVLTIAADDGAPAVVPAIADRMVASGRYRL